MKRHVSWFLDLYHNGQLNLDPPYQRRSVWTVKDRRFFLDTIFQNYPCPAVFLHKEVDGSAGKMIYHVVDGKQRLETILRFFQNSLALDPGFGDPRLAGKKWKSLEGESDLRERFVRYELAVEYIDTADKQFINDVFDRLNRTSRKLERQELRHAKYDGWLITVAEAEAEKEEWERLGVVTKARIRRMKDVQCISELLLILLKDRIAGYDQDDLDALYAEYDSPRETVSGFDEDGFLSRLDLTKGYLIQMECHNSSVTKHARGFADIYSLWASVALNEDRLPAPEIAADRYAEFMGRVRALARTKDVTLMRDYENSAYLYLKNSAQSSADHPQRTARNAILEGVLLKSPGRGAAQAAHDGNGSFPPRGQERR